MGIVGDFYYKLAMIIRNICGDEMENDYDRYKTTFYNSANTEKST